MPALDKSIVSFISDPEERDKAYLILSNFFHQAIAEYRAGYEKVAVEFSRYKQDCRKRALEMAHSEAGRTIFERPANPLENAQRVTKSVDVIPLADKYYSWLISIPE